MDAGFLGSSRPSPYKDASIQPESLGRLDHLRQKHHQGACDVAERLELAHGLWQQFEIGAGHALFVELIEAQGLDADSLRSIAQRYFEVGRFREAATVMELAVRRHPRVTAAFQNTWAWILERDHQVDAARVQADFALRLDPSYTPAVRLLAHLDRRANHYDAALRRIEHHLAHHSSPLDWILHQERAAILDRCQLYKDAWSSLEQAKAALRGLAADPLKLSRQIRQRQWELTQQITPADIRRWNHELPHDVDTTRICFLTGFPRSGTTLLEQVLSSHQDVIDTDESGILAAHFIAPVVWHAADTMDALIEMRSWDREQLEIGRATFIDFTQEYLQQSIGHRWLLEKNPLLTADIPMAFRLFPHAQWIFALRDPRDVLLSYLFTMVPLNWSSAPAITPLEAARFYADTMRHLLWWRQRLPAPVAVIRYERMIDAPEAEFSQLAAQLKIDWDDRLVDAQHRADRKAARTPTYHDVTQPIYRRAVGRWQHYEFALADILPMLAPFVAEWGHE